MAPMALLIPLVAIELAQSTSSRIGFQNKSISQFIPAGVTAVIFAIFLISWKSYLPEIFQITPSISEAAQLGLHARDQAPYLVIKDLDDFSPTIAFYSHKPFLIFRILKENTQLHRPFQITLSVTELKDKTGYKIIHQIDDHVLVLFE